MNSSTGVFERGGVQVDGALDTVERVRRLEALERRLELALDLVNRKLVVAVEPTPDSTSPFLRGSRGGVGSIAKPHACPDSAGTLDLMWISHAAA